MKTSTEAHVAIAGDWTSSDFAAFFRDVHDCDPFPWQRRLATEVLGREVWPKVIDLPTGTGKTAVLDIAIFTMAAQPAISPRRVVFVIDRRIVVDQVYERAQRIRERIDGGSTPILRQIRDRLQKLSGAEPLGVVSLRGGVPIDDGWTHRPDQPWVMVSTVDQFGSRLLFRGYGVTPGMRPIHAGLAGNDCLVILDEVHLSVPFAETLAQVDALHSGPLPRRFAIVEMSATPSNKSVKPFTLDSATDLEGCEELRRRVRAGKQAQLESVQDQDSIPAAVLKIVKSTDKSNGKVDLHIRSIGVVVNSVRTARKTYDALTDAGYATHLITGRMRPLDRIDALDRIGPIVDPDRNQRGDQLTVVVSTQAIEVGADFSFDACITECAAVDSLRQRFGRLDRRGTYSTRSGNAARAWIIGPKSIVASKKPDAIYGESTKVTWEELERRANRGVLDVGSMSLRDFPCNATAPRARAPLLLKTHMDAWTQTRPEPIVQPSVDWFLHGIDQDRPADVSILWRWDRSSETLRLVPPRQAEFVQVPFGAAKLWLSGDAEVDVADIAQADVPESVPAPVKPLIGDCVRWTGFGSGAEQCMQIKDIRPGDVLIVDPRQGGLNAGTWDPSSNEPAADLGDAAQIAYKRKATLRLDPRLPDVDSPPTPADEAEVDLSVRERIAAWLERHFAETDQQPDWLPRAIERLGSNFEVTSVGLGDGDSSNGYYILTERHPVTKKSLVDPSNMDGSDESGSLTGTGVTLIRHLEGVGERAGHIAERLGLPVAIVEDLRFSGRLHDLGKVDYRFQLQLVGGDPVELERRRREPLAKSLPDARRVWRYPRGMRHEVASVAMIESNSDVLSSAHDKDLVLHLVGTHHGWGRPLPPIVEDPEPQILSYTVNGHSMEASSDLVKGSLAIKMADRFWRLVERYGYHGLAWLEAILRLADHQQSAMEAERS